MFSFVELKIFGCRIWNARLEQYINRLAFHVVSYGDRNFYRFASIRIWLNWNSLAHTSTHSQLPMQTQTAWAHHIDVSVSLLLIEIHTQVTTCASASVCVCVRKTAGNSLNTQKIQMIRSTIWLAHIKDIIAIELNWIGFQARISMILLICTNKSAQQWNFRNWHSCTRKRVKNWFKILALRNRINFTAQETSMRYYGEERWYKNIWVSKWKLVA